MNDNDIALINKIKNTLDIDSDYWDFKNSKKEFLHGICSYPATMVPMMLSELIKFILEIDPNVKNLLDPFMGSGTTLLEGVNNNLEVFGIDINPLAYLLSEFKVSNIDIESLKKDIELLSYKLNDEINFKIVYFKKINKWYKEDIISDLSKIQFCIKNIENKESRNFFWICLAETSRLSNNSKNSTFKLHIKSKDEIENFKCDSIDLFKKIVAKNFESIINYISLKNTNNIQNPKSNLFLGNSIDILKNYIPESSIDLIITSPPYGDNHTTVTYGQFSVLPLRWINLNDISPNIKQELINYDNRIDKNSLGGINYKENYIVDSNILSYSETISLLYNKLLIESDINKSSKLASFYIDFYNTFKEMTRVLKKNCYMILTVGNRRISDNEVHFDKILKELSTKLELEFIYQFDRNILNKRIPNKISKLKNKKAVKSMSKEYTLIFRKK